MEPPLERSEDLLGPFYAAERPPADFRIGAEVEKFGVVSASLRPIDYAGEQGVVAVLRGLEREFGWSPVVEQPGGPVIALRRDQASITLEPGAQLELSGTPFADVHLICAELRAHLSELKQVSEPLGLSWLGVGFHPIARQADLPWVPKLRYGVMKRYLLEQGSGAHDMMRRTATVQANFDYESESDALKKLCLCLRVSPLVNALTANSPFYEGRLAGKKSVRGEVWLNMDPARSGLIEPLWRAEKPGYADYVEWALDAGMFLFKRGDRAIYNTGQKFRDFMQHGFEGQRATLSDWKLHLTTLFPEARLKNTLEVRSCDGLPTDLACSVPALFTGLLYDAEALDQASELVQPLDFESVEKARPGLVRHGLDAEIGGQPARALAMKLLEIALFGLERRARLSPSGKDERVHLTRLAELVRSGRVPADLLTEGLDDTASDLSQVLSERTRL